MGEADGHHRRALQAGGRGGGQDQLEARHQLPLVSSAADFPHAVPISGGRLNGFPPQREGQRMKSLSQSDQPPGGQLKEPDLPSFLLFHQLNLYPIKDDGGGSFAFIPPPRQPPQEQPGEGLRLQTKKRDWNESETQIPPLVLMGSSGGWSDTRKSNLHNERTTSNK